MSDNLELTADLMISLQTQDLVEFKSLLSSSNPDISSLQDEKQSNILHFLSRSPIPELTQKSFLVLIQSFCFRKYEEMAPTHIEKLLNTQSDLNQDTPLMLAVQYNKISLVREFIKLGADPNIKNKDGQTLAHLASKLGFFHILVYLKYELDLDLELLDDNLMSPLSLAVMEGRESVVSALISWGSDLKIKDKEGKTLLHLAALSGNYRIAKVLVLRGLERSTKNAKGVSAYELAKKDDKKLRSVLREISTCGKFNPFRAPLSPLKNSYMLFTLYVMIFILRYGLVVSFLLPTLPIEFAIVSICLFIINFALFLSVHQSDPGFVPQVKGQNIIKLYKNVHYDSICTFCENIKGQKVFHCHHCDRCIEGYDHHCPWIRNCVGKRNVKLFFAFLTASLIDFLFTSVVGMLDFFKLLWKKRRFFNYNTYPFEFGGCVTLICIICFVFTFPIWFIQVRNFIYNSKRRPLIGLKELDSKLDSRLFG